MAPYVCIHALPFLLFRCLWHAAGLLSEPTTNDISTLPTSNSNSSRGVASREATSHLMETRKQIQGSASLLGAYLRAFSLLTTTATVSGCNCVPEGAEGVSYFASICPIPSSTYMVDRCLYGVDVTDFRIHQSAAWILLPFFFCGPHTADPKIILVQDEGQTHPEVQPPYLCTI